jgi:hypothetical protein
LTAHKSHSRAGDPEHSRRWPIGFIEIGEEFCDETDNQGQDARKQQGCPPERSRFRQEVITRMGPPNVVNGDENMGLAQYSIVPIRDQWGVLHDGNINGEYATKESAFESAVAAASLAIRQGHEVHVSVPAREEGQAAMHSRPG